MPANETPPKTAAAQGIVLPTPLRRFTDLALTGPLLEERCFVVEPGLVRIYLRLSATPPLGWSHMFTNAWQALEYDGKPVAGVEGDAVWVECKPEELEAQHLPKLRPTVAQANVSFRAYVQEKATAQRAQKALDSHTRAQLQELRHLFGAPTPGPATAKPEQRNGWFGHFLRRYLDRFR